MAGQKNAHSKRLPVTRMQELGGFDQFFPILFCHFRANFGKTLWALLKTSINFEPVTSQQFGILNIAKHFPKMSVASPIVNPIKRYLYFCVLKILITMGKSSPRST